MLKVALLVERQAYLDAHAEVVDQTGKRPVVGNGYAKERQVTTGAGMVEVKASRVDDRREGQHYRSVILPAYMRKSPKVTEVLPVLYLRGLSTGDFAPALGEFFGSGAGLSASTVSRLTESWQDERERWADRDLSGTDYVYWWADGIHFNVRLEEDRLCCLVIVGVRPDGTKELVALADGYRESKESWAALLRSLRQRGLAGPVLAVGDGALGFWAALRDVFPSTKEQRCWVHRTANCTDALPKRLHPQAKSAIQAIYNAGSRTEALTAAKSFADAFSGFPKATAKITDELDTLLAFYDFPKEHWAHLRTSNHRVDLLDRKAEDQGYPRRRLTQTRPSHGLQAARRCPSPLAQDNRSRARPTGASGCHLHRRQTTREEASRDRARGRHDRVRRSLSKNLIHNT
jgi:transposase-like protein